MLQKRLNILLYSNSTGEQIILPVNPENIELKYGKNIETYDILGFGKVNISGEREPIKIKLSHFLPEDDSAFNTNSGIMYRTSDEGNFTEQNYSLKKAIEILRKWAYEQNTIRLVIDEVLNIKCIVVSFAETVRESTKSTPYILEIVEYTNPIFKAANSTGLYSSRTIQTLPKTVVMKKDDTVYSIADKYGIDYKKLAQINGIDDVNKTMAGTVLSLIGV